MSSQKKWRELLPSLPMPMALTAVLWATLLLATPVAAQSCDLVCRAWAEPPVGGAPLKVQFNIRATSTCPDSLTYLWCFGDGTPCSSEQAPAHSYDKPGNYRWDVTVTSASGSACTEAGVVTVSGGGSCSLSCTASALPDFGPAPLAVAFTADSTHRGCSGSETYLWDFGDGSPPSGEQNPAHTYGADGVYHWRLMVSLESDPGAMPCMQMGKIVVGGSPRCELICRASAAPERGAAPLAVSFASFVDTAGTCTLPIAISWDFGDGATSSEPDPQHVYTAPGRYRWQFTASSGESRCVREGVIHVVGPMPALNLQDVTANPGETASLPLVLASSGVAVCAASCDIPFNPEMLSFVDAQPGPAATEAGKEVVFSSPAPGICRVGIYGSNQTVIPDGEIAYVRFLLLESASGVLRVGNLCGASDCEGNLVGTGCSGATITAGARPGDCDGDREVNIAEVQKSVNMFLGELAPGCGADCNGDGAITIDEVQKVVNTFLGLSASC